MTRHRRSDLQVPRAVHPGAWWMWALGLATAASRTTNPLLHALLLAVAAAVVTSRRGDAPWARSFALFLKLGLVVIAVRVIGQVVLGVPTPGTVLFTLPQVGLPAWAAGISLGGPVTAPSLAAAVADGFRLATILGCIGAANALANPRRLLAALPAALYEVGVAVVVALSFAPSLVTSVQRIRAARRLRGRPDRGLRGMITVAMPVLEDALERSLELAAAMDSRGYGRRAAITPGARRSTAILTLGGLLGTCVGVYGLLDGSGPPAIGIPVLVAGLLAAGTGTMLAGRRTVRSRYRPDPWALPEWVTAGAGVAVAATSIVGGLLDPVGLHPQLLPLAALPLPAVVTGGILVGLLPGWWTPPPLLASGTVPRRRGRDAPVARTSAAGAAATGAGDDVRGGTRVTGPALPERPRPEPATTSGEVPG